MLNYSFFRPACWFLGSLKHQINGFLKVIVRLSPYVVFWSFWDFFFPKLLVKCYHTRLKHFAHTGYNKTDHLCTFGDIYFLCSLSKTTRKKAYKLWYINTKYWIQSFNQPVLSISMFFIYFWNWLILLISSCPSAWQSILIGKMIDK